MGNSTSSQSLYSTHNQISSQNDVTENIYVRENSSKKVENLRVEKTHLTPSNSKSTRLISDPGDVYAKKVNLYQNNNNNNSIGKNKSNNNINNKHEQSQNIDKQIQVENYKNESFDDTNSLNERSSINSNLLNAENQSIKSHSLAKFRSSSPRDPSSSNSNSHSQSSLNDYDFNEDSSLVIKRTKPINVNNSRVKSDSINSKPNQAVEGGPNPGPLGDIQVTNFKIIKENVRKIYI
jgi:hypothetical protein